MSLFIYFFITFHISPPLLIPRGRKGNEGIKNKLKEETKSFFSFYFSSVPVPRLLPECFYSFQSLWR